MFDGARGHLVGRSISVSNTLPRFPEDVQRYLLIDG